MPLYEITTVKLQPGPQPPMHSRSPWAETWQIGTSRNPFSAVTIVRGAEVFAARKNKVDWGVKGFVV